jgi:hypothetical protein
VRALPAVSVGHRRRPSPTQLADRYRGRTRPRLLACCACALVRGALGDLGAPRADGCAAGSGLRQYSQYPKVPRASAQPRVTSLDLLQHAPTVARSCRAYPVAPSSTRRPRARARAHSQPHPSAGAGCNMQHATYNMTYNARRGPVPMLSCQGAAPVLVQMWQR